MGYSKSVITWKCGKSEKTFPHGTEEQKKALLRKVANRTEEEFQTFNLDHIFLGREYINMGTLIKRMKIPSARGLEHFAEAFEIQGMETKRPCPTVLAKHPSPPCLLETTPKETLRYSGEINLRQRSKSPHLWSSRKHKWHHR